MKKTYTTATAFRMALEERLNNFSKSNKLDIQMLRRKVAFDRLLTRLFKVCPEHLFLKGGYSMELRMQKSRTTKDIDLVIKTEALKENYDQEIFEILQRAAKQDLGDYFTFIIGEPTLDLRAVPYGGSRFPVEVRVDKRQFIRFPMDVIISSLILDPIDKISSEEWLTFAGIETPKFPTISQEQQFAEKLHAYTFPREEEANSRVKDLIDLILLIQSQKLKKDFLITAIHQIFEYRNTHHVPQTLEKPPDNWLNKFKNLSIECGLSISMDNAFSELAIFMERLR